MRCHWKIFTWLALKYGRSRTPLLFKEKKKATETISIDHQTSWILNVLPSELWPWNIRVFETLQSAPAGIRFLWPAGISLFLDWMKGCKTQCWHLNADKKWKPCFLMYLALISTLFYKCTMYMKNFQIASYDWLYWCAKWNPPPMASSCIFMTNCRLVTIWRAAIRSFRLGSLKNWGQNYCCPFVSKTCLCEL